MTTGHADHVGRNRTLDVLDLIELRPPAGATPRYPHVTSTGARRWPSEEIWRLRKRP